MIKTYQLVKSFPGYKKGLTIKYNTKNKEVLEDLYNEEFKLICELPDEVIEKNSSWFKEVL